MLSPLTAVSPVDGRYHSKTAKLGDYFSEFALIRYRVRVEIEYFISLCELPLPQLAGFDPLNFDRIRAIYRGFSEEDAAAVKQIERTTNHDVKAVEYFIKQKFTTLGIDARYGEFVHFGLTSQDINNTSVPLSLKEGIAGKEFGVFAARLAEQMRQLSLLSYPAKFGGATGNMNAHHVAYPSIDWKTFADGFVEKKLGLAHSWPTTQIEHYDNLAAIFDCLARINTILIDFSRDIWTYISMEYFRQKVVAGEVGSSAMPHKVNPIDFENAEGNLGVANAVYHHLSAKLPISRMQRDLTDSTVLRNVGVPIAHSVIALESLKKGLGKLILNEAKLKADLENNWAVVAEGIQTILRREGYPNPYETLKALTRTGEGVSQKTISDFIDSLSVSDSVKEELRAISPSSYTGL